MSGASPRDPFSPGTSIFNVRATTKTYSLTDIFKNIITIIIIVVIVFKLHYPC